MASISSSEKPALAKDAVHDGGRPTNLERVDVRGGKKKACATRLPFVDMYIVLKRRRVSTSARKINI